MTLWDLSAAFGLTRPDSVRNLIRLFDRALLGSRWLRDEIETICHRLPKPKNGPDPAKPDLAKPARGTATSPLIPRAELA